MMPTAAPRELRTLAYPIDPDLLGDVVAYPLTAEFAAAWQRFADKIKRRVGRDEVTPSHAGLATALTAISGQPTRLFSRWELSDADRSQGVEALLATTDIIDPWHLETAFGEFERLSDVDETNTLAPCLAAVSPQIRPLSDYIWCDGGRVGAAGWIFDAARWRLARLIAEEPVLIDEEKEIQFRLDTDGHLVAWDDPISHAWTKGPGHALIYISTKIVTLPGAARLYLRLDAHVSRLADSWDFVKNAWVARTGDKLPLLKLPIRAPWPAKGRHTAQYGSFAAEIVEACGLDPLTLPPHLPDRPGRVRPIGNPRRHPIGKGPGARFLYQLSGQTERRLGVPPLSYTRTPVKVHRATTGPIERCRLDSAIAASGTDRLRIVCLYRSTLTRQRMADALAAYSSTDSRGLVGLHDDVETLLTDRLGVVFHHAPELLAHGDHDREPGLDTLAWLSAPMGCRVTALVETEWDGDQRVPHDAKHILRRMLGARDVVAQFINSIWTPPKPGRRRKTKTAAQPTDHAATTALRDLFRQAGIIDNRLAAASASAKDTAPLDRPAILVGLHVRQHTPRRRLSVTRTGPQLVVQLVAIRATPDENEPWTIQMYCHTRQAWVPYATAAATYYTSDIGSAKHGRDAARAQQVRDYVDAALAELHSRDPIVVFVEAEACRTIWRGIQNGTLGHGALPGSTLNTEVAVVRVGHDDKIPRPVHRTDGQQPNDRLQPAMPGAYLYAHAEGPTTSWMLAQPSRTHSSGEDGARAGTYHTRWTLPDHLSRWMSKDWHAITGTEITIARAGAWEPLQLAALAARLCHQAASWDDRTQSPSPLHLAEASDEDHPARSFDTRIEQE